MKKILLVLAAILVLGGIAFTLTKSSWLKGEFEDTSEVTVSPDFDLSVNTVVYDFVSGDIQTNFCFAGYPTDLTNPFPVIYTLTVNGSTTLEEQAAEVSIEEIMGLQSGSGCSIVHFEVAALLVGIEVESLEIDMTLDPNSGIMEADESNNHYVGIVEISGAATELDSDKDGLLDENEVNNLGTDPFNADSDGDALGDYAEVITCGSNPKSKDSDDDGLGDYSECITYHTDPNNRDSDDDGFGDYTEAINNKTDPNKSEAEEPEVMEEAPIEEAPIEEALVTEPEIEVEETPVEEPEVIADTTTSSGGGGGGAGGGSSSSNDEEEYEPEEVETDSERPKLIDIKGHWAEDYINQLYYDGVVSGYSNGRFGPDDKITRAQIVKIALLAFDHELETDFISIFSDIPSSEWYTNYVLSASRLEIVSGYDDDTFRPNNNVTRAEALKIILVAGSITEFGSKTPNFSDVNVSSDWFAKYTAYAKSSGLVGGYSDGTFRGNQSVTRAEACKIVVELLAK